MIEVLKVLLTSPALKKVGRTSESLETVNDPQSKKEERKKNNGQEILITTSSFVEFYLAR